MNFPIVFTTPTVEGVYFRITINADGSASVFTNAGGVQGTELVITTIPLLVQFLKDHGVDIP